MGKPPPNIYDVLPSGAIVSERYQTLKEASVPGTFRHWHHCPKCNGWIAGAPEKRTGKETLQPLSPGSEFIVTGPREITFHCVRCATQLARRSQ